MLNLIDILNNNRIIPVIVIDNVEHAIPLAETLFKFGFNVLEVTLRTACALAAIEKISIAFPKAIIGAGTIIDPQQLFQAKSAGAKFAVSPGLSKTLVLTAKELNIPYLPGIATASEALLAHELNLKYVKFYPAERMGGIKTLLDLAEVLPLHFCPTGGVNNDNLINYLNLDCVICVGGTWIAPRNLIANNAFAEITLLSELAQKALKTALH